MSQALGRVFHCTNGLLCILHNIKKMKTWISRVMDILAQPHIGLKWVGHSTSRGISERTNSPSWCLAMIPSLNDSSILSCGPGDVILAARQLPRDSPTHAMRRDETGRRHLWNGNSCISSAAALSVPLSCHAQC